MPLSDEKRQRFISGFTPLEAIKTFVSGKFYYGDDDFLMEAIQKDGRIGLAKDEIMEIIYLGMDAAEADPDDLDGIAQRCLDCMIVFPGGSFPCEDAPAINKARRQIKRSADKSKPR